MAWALALIFIFVGLEIAAQAHYHFIIKPSLDSKKQGAGVYYRASNDGRLSYELKPRFRYSSKDRDLYINSLGFRGAEIETTEAAPRLAVLGDSVTFGTGHAQADTIPSLLEKRLAADCKSKIEVLNLGVPGYGTEELLQHLKAKAPSLELDAVIYLMNLNDFARRNTLYEGADNGLYRMFAPPTLKLPWYLRKALYLWKEGPRNEPTLEWYRWLAAGSARQTFEDIGAMNTYADELDFRFATMILPSRLALVNDGNQLAALHEKIVDALKARSIPVSDAASAFAGGSQWLNSTDHLTGAGNRLVAEALAHFFSAALADLASKAGCPRANGKR